MSWRTDDARAFDDALRGRVPTDAEIAHLVAQAERVCELAASVSPSPAFMSSLRTALMAEAATILTSRTTPAPPAAGIWARLGAPARRRIAVGVAALVTAFGMVGLTGASASALPGDALYPVKRGVEVAELSLRRGDDSRGAFELERATRRLAEVNGLTRRPATAASLAATTLNDYSAEAGNGSDALVRSFKASHHRGSIVTINRFAGRAHLGLERLDGKLTGAAATQLDAAQQQLADIVALAARLCPDCGGIDADLVKSLIAPAPSAAVPAAPPAPAEPVAALPPVAPAPVAEPKADTPAEKVAAKADNKPVKKKTSAPAVEVQPTIEAPSTEPSTVTPPPIPAPVPPTAAFSCDELGNSGKFNCVDASTGDPTGWAWSFGDASVPDSAQQNPPQFEYPAPGSYTVTLTVTNADGANTATQTITVN